MEWLTVAVVASTLVAGFNLYFYKKVIRFAARFAPRVERAVPAAFLAINSPFLFLVGVFLSGKRLHEFPLGFLKWFVYPFYAWLAMLAAFWLLAAPKDLLVGVLRGIRWVRVRTRSDAGGLDLSRRDFLGRTTAGLGSLVPPLLYAVFASGLYGGRDLEISAELVIPVPGLPRALDGLTITQISDLHTGAYIRERELATVVEQVNRLRGDLVVVTGDMLDSSLAMLPVAQQALERIRAGLGVYGILGNHDYYSDRRLPGYPGCLRIIQGMEQAGVKMLRNSRAEVRVGAGQERLVLAGVDWTGLERGNPIFYDRAASRLALDTALKGEESGAPRILLAHHPHVFFEAPSYRIALTLAGHTHGGGQIVIAEKDGRPIAIGSAIFSYVSGLYRTGEHLLYVNRGIGFVGVPIRIQCPPEISRFRLSRA